MLKADADRWVEALKSGRFSKGTGYLKIMTDPPKFCCLGVACELDNVQPTKISHDHYTGSDVGHFGSLGDAKVLAGVTRADGMRPLALADDHGSFIDHLNLFVEYHGKSDAKNPKRVMLTVLNDRTAGFDTVIKAIETYWEQL